MDYATFPWKCSADSLTNISMLLLPSPELGFRAAVAVPVLSGSDGNAGRAGEQRALGEPDSTWAFSFSSLPRKIKIYSPLRLLEKEGGKVQEYFKYLLFFLRGKNAMWFHSSHANIYVSKGEARSERKAGFGCDMGFGARDVDLLLAQAQIACLTLGQSRSPLCPQLPSCSSPHF